jgi:hypothetical protein
MELHLSLIGKDLIIQVVIVMIGVEVINIIIVGRDLKADINLMEAEGMIAKANLEAEVVLIILGT